MARSTAAASRLALNLLLAASAILLTVLAFELGARLLIPEWAPKHNDRSLWAHHELLGWAHEPNSQSRHLHRDFSVGVRINSMGFRDRDYSLERVPGTPRMLLVGDSFGFGFGVEYDEMITSILESRHPHWEIINTAVSGWGTDQQLLFMREEGQRLRPDVVLLLFHPNDVEDSNARRRYRYPKPQFVLEEGELVLTNVPVRRLGPRERIDRYLFHRTYVLHKVWTWRRLLSDILQERSTEAVERTAVAETSAAGEEGAAPARPARDPCRGRNPDFEVSRALLRELHALLRSIDARLLVASIPGRCPDPRDLLAELLPELGVAYLPLDEAFEGIAREQWRFPHDPHWNSRGQRVAADAIEAFLREEGVLP